MPKTLIYDNIESYFESYERPDWYNEAVHYLRGGADEGLFGLFLYNYIKQNSGVTELINIGTARGHSAVCMAKGIKQSGNTGVVHTIDVIPPNESRNWHVPKQSDDDPAAGEKLSMKQLISHFHPPTDKDVPIRFHTGESNDLIRQVACSPDLVFHDGEHTYQTVSTDIDIVKNMSGRYPVQVFDDCYLYDYEWKYRPFVGSKWSRLAAIPKIMYIINKSRRFSINKSRYPGVTRAVKEEVTAGEYNTTEVVRDENHAPITILR